MLKGLPPLAAFCPWFRCNLLQPDWWTNSISPTLASKEVISVACRSFRLKAHGSLCTWAQLHFGGLGKLFCRGAWV